jgi:hypothetical protein
MGQMEGLRAAAGVDAYYTERSIFSGRFGFRRRPGLVVIDLANGWTDPRLRVPGSPWPEGRRLVHFQGHEADTVFNVDITPRPP